MPDGVDVDAIMRQLQATSPGAAPPVYQGTSSIPFNPPTSIDPSTVGNGQMQNEGMASTSRAHHAEIGNLITGLTNAVSKVAATKKQTENAQMTSKMGDAINAMNATAQAKQVLANPNSSAADKALAQHTIQQNSEKIQHLASDPKFSKAFLKATSIDLTNPDKNSGEQKMLTQATQKFQQQQQLQTQAAQAKAQAVKQVTPQTAGGSQPGLPNTRINPQPMARPASTMGGGSQPGLPGTGISPVPITRPQQNPAAQMQARAQVMPSMGFPQNTAPAVMSQPVINPNQPATSGSSPQAAAPAKKEISAMDRALAQTTVGMEANPQYEAWAKKEEKFQEDQRKMLMDLLKDKLEIEDKKALEQMKDDAVAKRWHDHDAALYDKMTAEQQMHWKIALHHDATMIRDAQIRAAAMRDAHNNDKKAVDEAFKNVNIANEGITRIDGKLAQAIAARDKAFPQNSKTGLNAKDETAEDRAKWPEYHSMNVGIHLLESQRQQYTELNDLALSRIAGYNAGTSESASESSSSDADNGRTETPVESDTTKEANDIIDTDSDTSTESAPE